MASIHFMDMVVACSSLTVLIIPGIVGEAITAHGQVVIMEDSMIHGDIQHLVRGDIAQCITIHGIAHITVGVTAHMTAGVTMETVTVLTIIISQLLPIMRIKKVPVPLAPEVAEEIQGHTMINLQIPEGHQIMFQVAELPIL